MYFHPFLDHRVVDSHPAKPHRGYQATLSKVKAAQNWKRIGPFRHQIDFKHNHRPDNIPSKPQIVPRYIYDKAAFKLKARGLKNIITNFSSDPHVTVPAAPIVPVVPAVPILPDVLSVTMVPSVATVPITLRKQCLRYPDTPQLSSNNSSTSLVTCSEATISVETRDVYVQTLSQSDVQSIVSIQTGLASSFVSMSIHESDEESSFESSSILYTDSDTNSNNSTPFQSTASFQKQTLPTLEKTRTAWTKPSQYQGYLKPKQSIKRIGKMAWKVVSQATRQLFERSFEPSRRLSFSPGSTYDDLDEYDDEYEAGSYDADPEQSLDVTSVELQRWYLDKAIREEGRIERRFSPLDYSPVTKPVWNGTLHCKVLQVTNLGSAKGLKYELQIRCHGISKVTRPGIMKKVAKGISAASPLELFSLQVPKSYITRPRNSATRLISYGVSKAKKLLYRRIRLLREDSDDSLGDEACETTQWIGYKRIDLNENMDREVSSRHLYSLASPFEAAQVWQPEIAVVYRFQPTQPISEFSYPNGPGTGTDEYLNITNALNHCNRGDYLTIYQQGPGCPLWIRYWARLDKYNIVLYRLSNEHKNPASLISLKDLCFVSTPLEDEEQIFLGRPLGLVLDFDNDHTGSYISADLEEGNRIGRQEYILMDSLTNADYWYRALLYCANSFQKQRRAV
ncbi:hypothetical protein J3Q64DRAFT_1697125 [Phycomyces blakesleeanus]|uniref:PH domain-containing protein n=2 Tax=Phycomyces blakesleeanus TaxID=4837 RepID=A0A162UEH8_PHYB8|nr:hypothetical protein PHYBLDRAFT_167921 [Phycomyces blakesleeanus NRRL 1555(-)]OAD74513.1 hypothetical protein PHYBLDRAFT_167921 [Phycomyces blakesleeanus NRRL 1555(-)]|eukprot:XP_018292553.1 hypothetical protein PHYBLDRAFT_167921 [Phycomyces blakesleeanus NRRL 1555(-)]